VARTLAKIRAVGMTAFEETLRKRVFYLVLILAVFVIAGVASGRN